MMLDKSIIAALSQSYLNKYLILKMVIILFDQNNLLYFVEVLFYVYFIARSLGNNNMECSVEALEGPV